MRYPKDKKEIDNSSHYQLAKWYRFLPSPGQKSVGKPKFKEDMEKEADLLEYIIHKFNKKGRFTPELSKQIGWRE